MKHNQDKLEKKGDYLELVGDSGKKWGAVSRRNGGCEVAFSSVIVSDTALIIYMYIYDKVFGTATQLMPIQARNSSKT